MKILPMGIARICIGSGAINSKLSILWMLVTKEDPTKDARNAAKNAVASMGNESDPRSSPSGIHCPPGGDEGKGSFSLSIAVVPKT